MPRCVSVVEECRVLPDVFVSRGDEETRTRWQSKQVGKLWAALQEMPLMPRPEEVVGV